MPSREQLRAIRERWRQHQAELGRALLQRDRQRSHVHKLATAIASWSSRAPPGPLQVLAAEVLALHQELELQRQRGAAAAAAAEREGFRRGFVVGRGRSS